MGFLSSFGGALARLLGFPETRPSDTIAWTVRDRGKETLVHVLRVWSAEVHFLAPVTYGLNSIVTLQGVADKLKVKGSMRIRSCQIINDETFEFVGELQNWPTSVIEMLGQYTLTLERQKDAASSSHDRRVAKRFPRRFRVRSQELPEFGGLVEDVSLTGIRITTSGMVEAGTRIHIALDFDVAPFVHIRCMGEVMWCRDVGHWDTRKPECQVGIRFVNLTPQAGAEIKRFIESLELAADDKVRYMVSCSDVDESEPRDSPKRQGKLGSRPFWGTSGEL